VDAGEIDRDALMQRVFNDAAARRRLNAATHLPIGVEILRQLAWHWLHHRCLVVVDMPLLIETGSYGLTWPRVLVCCPPDCNVRLSPAPPLSLSLSLSLCVCVCVCVCVGVWVRAHASMRAYVCGACVVPVHVCVRTCMDVEG
jgi:hypothetical protein